MKTKRSSKNTAAPAAASVEPSIEAQTLKAPADVSKPKRPTLNIPPELTTPAGDRAMKFRVSQQFETLGDPCAETVETREAAEAAAAKMRGEIAAMVAGWETPAADDETSPTGYADEIAAWAHAATLADGAATYGQSAGEYIAEQAVEIEEVE